MAVRHPLDADAAASGIAMNAKLSRFDCIARKEFLEALTLNLPEQDLKALAEMLEMDTKIRKKAREMHP